MGFTDSELLSWITTDEPDEIESLFTRARAVREEHYGKSVFFRGLIEFTNCCKNDCYYCGIRRSNIQIGRYRLTLEDILDCCRRGDRLGYRTFVLQGGDDLWFTDNRLIRIIKAIRAEFPDHAITLSAGERSRESYEALFHAGVDRYLLRQEAAAEDLYGKLHPPAQSLDNRKRCLKDLREIGYQVGSGFITGAPFQTPEHLLADLRFLEELRPHMVGIGPFIPHKDTPMGTEPAGSVRLCLKMVAIVRILLPKALIPATTALGTIASDGRELALNAGANVIMPNLSPDTSRKLYALYDNKGTASDDSAEYHSRFETMVVNAGFIPDMSRGDAKQ